MSANVKVKPAPDRRCFYTPEGPEIEGDYFRMVVTNDLIESQIASGDLIVEKMASESAPAPASFSPSFAIINSPPSGAVITGAIPAPVQTTTATASTPVLPTL